jgi:hypothetical protein
MSQRTFKRNMLFDEVPGAQQEGVGLPKTLAKLRRQAGKAGIKVKPVIYQII